MLDESDLKEIPKVFRKIRAPCEFFDFQTLVRINLRNCEPQRISEILNFEEATQYIG